MAEFRGCRRHQPTERSRLSPHRLRSAPLDHSARSPRSTHRTPEKSPRPREHSPPTPVVQRQANKRPVFYSGRPLPERMEPHAWTVDVSVRHIAGQGVRALVAYVASDCGRGNKHGNRFPTYYQTLRSDQTFCCLCCRPSPRAHNRAHMHATARTCVAARFEATTATSPEHIELKQLSLATRPLPMATTATPDPIDHSQIRGQLFLERTGRG